MNIVDVKLSVPNEMQKSMGANIHFKVTFENDEEEAIVPANTDNRHYWEVREWYFKQSKKPFDFDFEPLPTGE